MRLDHAHTQVEGKVVNIEFDESSQTRATVDFETLPPEDADEDEEFESQRFEGYRTYRFCLSQILKFADMRKGDLRETVEVEDGDDYTRTIPGIESKVMDNLGDHRLVFKFSEGHDEDYNGSLIGVVSPKYATIDSNELDQLVKQIIAEMGVTDDPSRRVRRTGVVVEIDYSWQSDHEVESVGDKLGGGISIRNSVFGASSLRVNKFYTILACKNGLRVRDSEHTFKQIHMGSANELREAFEAEVRAQIENIWDETDLIERAGHITITLEDQLEWVENLAEEGLITKTAAEAISEELEKGGESDWNLGRKNAWNLVNAITGYATHHRDMVSTSSMKKLERAYDRVLKAEDRDELDAIAA